MAEIDLNQEMRNVEADIRLLEEHLEHAGEIKNKGLRSLIFFKITRLVKIFRDIAKILKTILEIEKEYPDFNMDNNIRKDIDKSAYFLNHVTERFTYAAIGPEIDMAKKLPKKISRKLHYDTTIHKEKDELHQELEIVEKRLIIYLKERLAEIDSILRKHKTKIEEERRKINKLRAKVHEIFSLFQAILKEIGVEEGLIEKIEQ